MLVSRQQDVVMECLDDADVSIRLQALELAAGMVTGDTLQPVVNRLVDQLRLASVPVSKTASDVEAASSPLPEAEGSEGEKPSSPGLHTPASLPHDYRIEVLHRILDMCSYNNYSEVVDFDWYVGVLVQLVRLLPPSETEGYWLQPPPDSPTSSRMDVAFRIGSEIRNVAVRVKGLRLEATRAAESLVLVDNRSVLFPTGTNLGDGVLGPVAWVVGEYAGYLLNPSRTLQSLIDMSNGTLPAKTLTLFLQAIPKVLVQVSQSDKQGNPSWRSEMALLLARVVEFLDSLAAHPDLDVQERAIEFLEILRLTTEAMRSEARDMPFLLVSVLPSLFMGLELNPVATSAQKKVTLPESLCLDEAFHDDLPALFFGHDQSSVESSHPHLLQDFYCVPDRVPSNKQPQEVSPDPGFAQPNTSYQNFPGGLVDDSTGIEKRKAERRERFRDDHFYIAAADGSSGTSTPLHGVLNSSNGDGLDIDTIPIVDLKLESEPHDQADREFRRGRRGRSRKMEVATDETFGPGDSAPNDDLLEGIDGPVGQGRSLLQVDSSGLQHFSLTDRDGPHSILSTDAGDAEMSKAMHRVEEMRLRMQRASERIQLEGTPAEGTLVKRKKKKKGKKNVASESLDTEAVDVEEATVKRKKKKKSSTPLPTDN